MKIFLNSTTLKHIFTYILLSIFFLFFYSNFKESNIFIHENFFPYINIKYTFYKLCLTIYILLILLSVGHFFIFIYEKILNSFDINKISLIILSFYIGVSVTSFIIYILSFFLKFNQPFFLLIFFISLSSVPLFLFKIKDKIYKKNYLKNISNFSKYIPIISLLMCLIFIILLTRGVIPGDKSHDFWSEYLGYYYDIIDKKSIIPSNFLSQYFISKAVGINFLIIFLIDTPSITLSSFLFLIFLLFIVYDFVYLNTKNYLWTFFSVFLCAIYILMNFNENLSFGKNHLMYSSYIFFISWSIYKFYLDRNKIYIFSGIIATLYITHANYLISSILISSLFFSALINSIFFKIKYLSLYILALITLCVIGSSSAILINYISTGLLGLFPNILTSYINIEKFSNIWNVFFINEYLNYKTLDYFFNYDFLWLTKIFYLYPIFNNALLNFLGLTSETIHFYILPIFSISLIIFLIFLLYSGKKNIFFFIFLLPYLISFLIIGLFEINHSTATIRLLNSSGIILILSCIILLFNFLKINYKLIYDLYIINFFSILLFLIMIIEVSIPKGDKYYKNYFNFYTGKINIVDFYLNSPNSYEFNDGLVVARKYIEKKQKIIHLTSQDSPFIYFPNEPIVTKSNKIFNKEIAFLKSSDLFKIKKSFLDKKIFYISFEIDKDVNNVIFFNSLLNYNNIDNFFYIKFKKNNLFMLNFKDGKSLPKIPKNIKRWLELKQSRLLDYFFYAEFNDYRDLFYKNKKIDLIQEILKKYNNENKFVFYDKVNQEIYQLISNINLKNKNFNKQIDHESFHEKKELIIKEIEKIFINKFGNKYKMYLKPTNKELYNSLNKISNQF